MVRQANYDVIIVGGGISGLGVARAAANKGWRTLLLEKNHCGEATSNASLRIIHGGLRYLQTLNLPRVVQSLRDQHDLLREMPVHVVPLPCMMPLARWGLKSRWPLTMALWCYWAIAGLAGCGWQRRGAILDSKRVSELVPRLTGKAPHGALFWNDAIMSDPLKIAGYLSNCITAKGGEVKEETEVLEISREQAGFRVRCKQVGGRMIEFEARTVVNTSGAWLHHIKKNVSGSQLEVPRYWCKAFNMILSQCFEEKWAIGLESDEGRLFFTVPRGEQSVVGTFYHIYEGKPDEVSVAEDELEAAIEGFNEVFPDSNITVSDVVAVEVGVLPARGERHGEVELYGAEKLYGADGYIEVVSTKYTTFRSQANRIVTQLSPFLGYNE